MIRKTLAIIALTILFFGMKSHFTHRTGNLLKPAATLHSWQWEQFGDASGGLYKEDDTLRCEVLKTDGTDWHVQLYQIIPPLVNGREYHLHFMAKADNNFVLNLSATTNGKDIHPIGLNKQIPLVSQWITYDYTFTAEKVNSKDIRVPNIAVGTQTGKVWIKDLSVEES